jgi:hypothetical protein
MEVERRRWKGKAALVWGGLGLALVGAVASVLSRIGWIPFLQNPGSFDRALLEAVVEQVRRAGVAPGETRAFRLEDLREPTSLRPCREGEFFGRGQGAGCVWARRSSAGKLAVVIETRDLGHAGEYGFAFSEEPLVPKPFGGGWSTIDVPGHLNLVVSDMKIDGSWWRVLYNLD